MKDTVDVAVMQFRPRPLDLTGNLRDMAAAVRTEATHHPTDLVVFPELATTGYIPAAYNSTFHRQLAAAADTVPGHTSEALGHVARETGTHIAVGLTERGEHDELFNTLLLLGPDGDIIGAHRKVHLWDQEPAYFHTGNRFDVLDTGLGGIGLSVCHDSRFPEATRQQVLNGAEILICVFAYAPDPGVPPGILTHRTVTRAWENTSYYILANRLGTEYGATYVGRSVIAGPTGQILTAGHGEQDPVIRARLHHQPLADSRDFVNLSREHRPDVYGNLTPVRPALNSPEPEAP
jgi:predicted amidohydrolase